jgi:Spy/CpxP family protein refolding chaperone
MNRFRLAILAIALSAAAVFILPAVTVAQGGPGDDHMGGEHHMPTVQDQLDELTHRLKLTDEQKPQVKAILEDMHAQMKQLRDSSTGTSEDTKGKMRDIHEKAHGRIRAILTEEQKVKFDKIIAEQHQHRMGDGHGDAGAPPPPPQQ